EARTVNAVSPVVVHVDADTEAPEIQVQQPAGAGTAVEGRPLPFQFTAQDNVRVTSTLVELLLDVNRDGAAADDEVAASIAFVAPPYQSAFTLRRFDDYLGEAADGVTQLAARLRITARDGAGNESV